MAGGNTGNVILLDFWPSIFGMRCRLALAMKGVNYESREEDIMVGKSQFLRSMNPVHEMIPVLVHGSRPVCESLLILEYIDEVWTESAPLMPPDPYERSRARFWADFVDKKLYGTGKKVWSAKEGELEAAKNEMIGILKVLEREALGGKLFFGGEGIGFLDVALIPFSTWFLVYEMCGKFSIGEECPEFAAWVQRCRENGTVSKSLVEPEEVLGYFLHMKKPLGGE